jgi:hypothetical protein
MQNDFNAANVPFTDNPLPLILEIRLLRYVDSTLKSIRKRNAARNLPSSETFSLGCVDRAVMAFMLPS